MPYVRQGGMVLGLQPARKGDKQTKESDSQNSTVSVSFYFLAFCFVDLTKWASCFGFDSSNKIKLNCYYLYCSEMGGATGFATTDVKLDPTGFDISISTILTQVGAEKYVNLFR